MYYWDEMTYSPHCEMKSGFTLADNSDDIFDICCTTSSNRACKLCMETWRMHGTVVLWEILVKGYGSSTLLVLPRKSNMLLDLSASGG